MSLNSRVQKINLKSNSQTIYKLNSKENFLEYANSYYSKT